MKVEKGSFEEAMKALENIVDRLEHAELSLDESIGLFMQGVELSRFCAGRLDEVERKITLLVEGEKGLVAEETLEEQAVPEA